jgi:hypothetical protein
MESQRMDQKTGHNRIILQGKGRQIHLDLQDLMHGEDEKIRNPIKHRAMKNSEFNLQWKT